MYGMVITPHREHVQPPVTPQQETHQGGFQTSQVPGRSGVANHFIPPTMDGETEPSIQDMASPYHACRCHKSGNNEY